MRKHMLLGFACVAGVCMALSTSDCRAEVKTKKIPYKHGDVECEGYLAWDDEVQGKRPGVLVVHEWWGLDAYARKRADMLAKLGYVAFAVDMYGKGKLAEHPQEAGAMAAQVRMNVKDWQARALKGLDLLKSQEQCDPTRTAAIGYCFGGSTVLQLAYSGADVKGVVSFHGAPQTPDDSVKVIKARILVCNGASDTFIPEANLQKMREGLDKVGADWILVHYAGAQHSFTVPDADQRNLKGIKYNKAADERSWRHMQDLFHEIFAK